MSGPSFWQTIMGRKTIEVDVPALVKNLGRIADALEVIAARLPPPSPPAPPSPAPARGKRP
jgi:hypothetical protein